MLANLALLAAAAMGSQMPVEVTPLEGVWAGAATGGATVSMHVTGQRFVLTDARLIRVGRLAMQPARSSDPKEERAIWLVDLTVGQTLEHGGRLVRPAAGPPILLGTAGLRPASLEMCLRDRSHGGRPGVAPGSPGRAECYRLRRATLPATARTPEASKVPAGTRLRALPAGKSPGPARPPSGKRPPAQTDADAKRQAQCVMACTQRNMMRPLGPEAISQSCRSECAGER